MQNISLCPSDEELAALQKAAYACGEDTEAAKAYDKLVSCYTSLQTIKRTYDQVQPAFAAVSSSLDSENEKSVISGLNQIIGGLDTMRDSLSQSLESTDIRGMMQQ